MCYIWHIVNNTTFERPGIKVNGMENFLLSHHCVSLDVSQLARERQSVYVFESHSLWEFLKGILQTQMKRKQSKICSVTCKKLVIFFFVLVRLSMFLLIA